MTSIYLPQLYQFLNLLFKGIIKSQKILKRINALKHLKDICKVGNEVMRLTRRPAATGILSALQLLQRCFLEG